MDDLEQAVEDIRKYARRREVDWLKAKLSFGSILIMPIEVYDNGSRMQVDITKDKRKTYAFGVDGVQLALADLIRDRYAGKSTYLDIYQELLGLGE